MAAPASDLFATRQDLVTALDTLARDIRALTEVDWQQIDHQSARALVKYQVIREKTFFRFQGHAKDLLLALATGLRKGTKLESWLRGVEDPALQQKWKDLHNTFFKKGAQLLAADPTVIRMLRSLGDFTILIVTKIEPEACSTLQWEMPGMPLAFPLCSPQLEQLAAMCWTERSIQKAERSKLEVKDRNQTRQLLLHQWVSLRMLSPSLEVLQMTREIAHQSSIWKQTHVGVNRLIFSTMGERLAIAQIHALVPNLDYMVQDQRVGAILQSKELKEMREEALEARKAQEEAQAAAAAAAAVPAQPAAPGQ